MEDENKKKEISVDDILNEYRAMEAGLDASASAPEPQPPADISGDFVWRPDPAVFEPERRAPEGYMPDANDDGEDWQERWEDAPRRRGHRGLRIGLTVALAMLLLAGGGVFGYTYATNTVFRGVTAGAVEVGGMSRAEAAQAITAGTQELIESSQVLLEINGVAYPIRISEVTNGIDAEASAEAAYAIGHTGGVSERVGGALGALTGGRQSELVVSINYTALNAALDEVAAQALTEPVEPSWKLEGSNLILDMGKPGVDFDRAVVGEAVREKIAAMDFTPYTVETQITDPQKPDLDAIAAEVNCDAVSAKVDKTDGKTIIPEQNGVHLDPEQAKTIVGDGSAASYTIPVELTPARVTAEVLERALFRDVLASTSTSLNTGNVDRTNNVTLAAKFMNGTILNPGDEFSYNGVVGERTEARGFKSAGAYSGGRVIDEVGGGVCQPSSTLYMAVLRADLQVTERSNHSFTVAYTPLGEDATVSWGGKDFRFVNNTDYPIKVVAERTGSKMRVTLMGTKVDDKSVELKTEILSTKEWTTIEKTDNSLAPGTSKVDQTGTTGYNTITYKYVTVNGETTKSVANKSYYSKRDKVVLVGPAKVETPAAAPETPAAPGGNDAPAAAPSGDPEG